MNEFQSHSFISPSTINYSTPHYFPFMKPAGEARPLWFMEDSDSATPVQAMAYTGHKIDDVIQQIHMQCPEIPESEMIILKLDNPIPLEPAKTLKSRLPPQITIPLEGPSRKVSEFFPELPNEDHLHLIVKKRPGPPGHTKKSRLITPPEAEFDIDAIDVKINKELKQLHDTIETFLKNPEPLTWIPPNDASSANSEFLKSLRIPAYANGKPSLLFHNLDICDHEEIEKIFKPPAPHMFICNTSGSGKTRRMLEALTKYWGFYMVATPDINGVGVRDVLDALDNIGEYQEWESDLRHLPSEKRDAQHDINRRIALKEFRKVLAARVVVFELFLQLAIKVDGELQEKHKRIWLLFQVYNPSSTWHPFLQVIEKCFRKASGDALNALVRRLNHIRDTYLHEPNFIFGLDEAQQAARLYPYSFVSSTSNTKFRSIIRAIAEEFTKSPIRLIVSGTGLSLIELQEASMASGISKPAHNVLIYHDLGIFDTWQKLRPFLECYVPATLLESPSGLRLQKRIREYLLGRYRFSVSFLEYLLVTGLRSPHRLLNEFIKAHTGCLPGDIGGPFTLSEPDLEVEIDLRGFEWDRLENDPDAQKEAAHIVQSHLTMGTTPIFGPVTVTLVEYGIARLRDGHNGHIVEPLAFLSVLKWLEGRDFNVQSNIRLRLAHPDSRGKAFEQLVTLYLLRILRDPIPLCTVFDFYGTPPDWANEKAQVIGHLDGTTVSVDVLGETPENPGLGVVQYADSIEEVIHWLQSSDAPAVLIASDNFGPDLMVLCRLSSGGIVRLMAQQKSYTTGKKMALDAKTMRKALMSLHRDNWFKKKPSDTRQKLIDAIEQFPVLRFVAGYPLSPEIDSTAKSVVEVRDSLGPVPLATLALDPFKALFLSEDEAKHVLGPLECALARKQNLATKRHRASKRNPLATKQNRASKRNLPATKQYPRTLKRKASEIS